MSLSLAQKFDHFRSTLLAVFFGLFPLFFLTFTQDFYDTNKWVLLILTTSALVIIWAVQCIIQKRLVITLDPGGISFGLLTIAASCSTIFSSTNKFEALVAPFGLATFACLTLIFLLRDSELDTKAKKMLTLGLFISGAILSVIAIYQFFGVGKIMFPTVTYLADESWTPAGSSFGLLSFLILVMPIAVGKLLNSLKSKTEGHIALLSILIVLFVSAILLTIIKLVPNLPLLILPLREGWAITVSVFIKFTQAFFGVGIENFLAAFTHGKTFEIDQTPLWNVRFVTNSNLILHIIATEGLLGGLGIIYLLKSVFPGKAKKALDISMYLVILVALISPPTFVFIVTIAAIFLLKSTPNSKVYSINLLGSKAVISYIASGISVLLVGLIFWGVFRIYSAENAFYRSLIALQNNNGTDTYNLQIQALTLVPYLTRYRLAYSQTNLALANALAQNTSATGSGGINEADRETISSLIQQSIREAKIAVNLAPQNVLVWENLARIYQNLVNVAQGSDQWALVAWNQAFRLDPNNPLLAISYGGMFLQVGDLDNAVLMFSKAVNLKPDWANAHYNLAYAYNQKKENLKAAVELTQTLQLLPATSTDRQKVSDELETVKKVLKPEELSQLTGQPVNQNPKPEEQLTLPTEEKQETLPVITPKIELSEESSPPATPAVKEEFSP